MDVAVNTGRLKVLQDFFNDLSFADQKKIFTMGFRKAVKPLVVAAKANVPYRTGQLRRSIGTIETPEAISILVGAKLSGVNKGWYGHFTEGGTKERFRKKKKNAPSGKITASHWFENAYNATEEQIYDTLEQEWYQAIDRYIVKVNKKLK